MFTEPQFRSTVLHSHKNFQHMELLKIWTHSAIKVSVYFENIKMWSPELEHGPKNLHDLLRDIKKDYIFGEPISSLLSLNAFVEYCVIYVNALN